MREAASCQEVVVLVAGAGRAGIQFSFAVAQPLGQGLGGMLITWRVSNWFKEAVFAGVEGRLVAIGGGLLAMGGPFDALTGFAVRGVLSLGLLAWTALPGVNDGGLDTAKLTRLDEQAWRR